MINKFIEEKLNEIDGILKKYDETVYCSVCEQDIQNYSNWCLENCKGLILSDDYLEIISKIDGFDYNGLSFYSLKEENDNNIFETNEIYWENENLREYLFIGEDSISWYCISINDNMFYILDKPSGSLINEYSDIEELLLTAFAGAI